MRRLLTLLCLLVQGYSGKAQNAEMFGYDTRRIATKSPVAASIDAFNRLGVNLATGIADIQVPLYRIELDNELSVPVTIKYHGSGFRFGEIPGVAGFKWALEAGGMVTRDINGMPDEEWYFDHYDSIPTYLDSMQHVGADENTVPQYYMKQLANNRIDINQDYYTLHFPAGSFNLVYRKGKFYAENDNYKLKITGWQEFVITDDKGYTYYFGGSGGGATTERSDPAHSAVPGYNDPEFNMGHFATTSWMLRKIVSPHGKEMNFEYERYNLGYVPSGIAETYKKGFVMNGAVTSFCGCPSPSLTVTTNGTTYETSLLTRIYTKETEVIFAYANNNLTYWKKQLDSVVIKHNISGKRIRKFQFEYGSFDNVYLKLTKVHEVNINDPADRKSWSFTYHGSAIPAFNSYARDIFGYYNGAANSRLIVSNNNIYTQTYASANRNPNLSYAKTAMLSAMELPTGGRVELDYELNNTGSRYAPGIRIKQISRYSTASKLAGKTVYEYTGLNGGIVIPFTIPEGYSTTWNCQIYTFRSDYPLNDRIANNFYYASVKEKQVSALDTIVTQYDYGANVNCQGQYQPYLKKQTSYLGTTGQKLQETIHTYQTEEIDSLTTRTYLSLGALIAYKPVFNIIVCFPLYQGYQELTPAPGGNHLLTATQTISYQNSAVQVTKDSLLYQSAYHRYPTGLWRTNSEGVTQKQTTKYVSDYNSLGNPAIAPVQKYIYDTMIARHITGVMLEREELADTSSLQRTRMSYLLGNDNRIHPDKKTVLYNDGTARDVEVFSKFDGNKVLEYKNAAGISNCLIWNYYSEHPIAVIANAVTGDVAYTSFEAGDTGICFSYQPAYIITGDGLTGTRCYAANGTISRTGLNTAQKYIVSLWTKNGIPACNSLNNWEAGETVNGWTLRKKILTGISNVTITGGNGYIDEVRLYPIQAQMSTSTFEPLIGTTAECDANDQLLFYQYDGFSRLTTVKNKEGNIISQVNYKFRDSTATGQWVLTGNFRCKPCPLNASYSTNVKQHEQINPGTGQTRWVDGAASDCSAAPDWQATGIQRCLKNANNENTGNVEQEQRDANPCSDTYNTVRWVFGGANTTACPLPCNSSNCSGNNKKCINGVCEWGTAIIVSSVYKNVGGTWKWECTNKFCFPDGTLSTYSWITYSTSSCPTSTCTY